MAAVLGKHEALFEEGLGNLKSNEAKIIIQPGAQPRFGKTHQVPCALQSQVEEELECLESEGIITPHSPQTVQRLLAR